jgi:hypothetical protein
VEGLISISVRLNVTTEPIVVKYWWCYCAVVLAFATVVLEIGGEAGV